MAEDDALEYGLRDAHELRYEFVEVGAAMALAYLLHSQQHRCGSCSCSSSVMDGCYVPQGISLLHECARIHSERVRVRESERERVSVRRALTDQKLDTALSRVCVYVCVICADTVLYIWVNKILTHAPTLTLALACGRW